MLPDIRNKDVLFPYLNGEDLNSSFNQSPNRWIINFQDWALDAEHDNPKKPKGRPYAVNYPDCWAIVKEKVKPERDKITYSKSAKEKWWQYERSRPELYAAIADTERVLVRARIANIHSMVYVPNGWVYNEKVVVFADCSFTILQSNIHEVWAREYSSSLKADMQYTPTDCFETFPFPSLTSNLEEIGEKYHTHRQSIMLSRQEGLTKTYNRFHNRDETATDIQQLRSLHVEMDNAVAAAYGWQDIDLGHDFHETKQGLRYTISETARREVLDRLLLLNHERYAEEVAQGLHDKGNKKGKSGGKKKGKTQVSPGQTSLF